MAKILGCNIVCEQNHHKILPLPNLVPVHVGRNRETAITDLRCSRIQVIATANYETSEVEFVQEGQNSSVIDGTAITKNSRAVAKHGSIIDIWHGDCVHKIVFEKETDGSNIDIPVSDRQKEGLINHSNVEISTSSKETVVELEETCENFRWQEINRGRLLIFSNYVNDKNKKVAGFDLDGTIIKTKSGKVFPTDKTDWMFFNERVIPKLKELIKKQYKIAIFTNQAGIGNGRVRSEDFKEKIENIVKNLKLPIQVFISTTSDIFRKPAPGMWTYMCEKVGNICIEESLYVGDAAGRVKNWEYGKKKDFSIADRLFAMNIGVKFFTPDEYFLGKPQAAYEKPMFDPSKCVDVNTDVNFNVQQKDKEVIVMVGAPGSGKSHFVKHFLVKKGYFSVSRDNLGSWQKCVAAMENKLISNQKVVIDNTNPDLESRSRYITVAKKYNIPVRCFVMNTTMEHCLHNNKFRELTDDSHVPVSPIIINSYSKMYVPPNEEEGFEEIIHIPFLPNFTSSERKELYRKFLYTK